MHQIQFQLNDQLFQSLQRRATANGFDSIDEYIVDFLENDLLETHNLDHFFTPERLAEIDEAVAQADQGLCLTREQSAAYLAEKRQAWLDQRKT